MCNILIPMGHTTRNASIKSSDLTTPGSLNHEVMHELPIKHNCTHSFTGPHGRQATVTLKSYTDVKLNDLRFFRLDTLNNLQAGIPLFTL